MEDKNMPAFPRQKSDSNDGAPGLTKREYVAAMALQALVGSGKTKAWSAEEKATEAVMYADLLFKALEK